MSERTRKKPDAEDFFGLSKKSSASDDSSDADGDIYVPDLESGCRKFIFHANSINRFCTCKINVFYRQNDMSTNRFEI